MKGFFGKFAKKEEEPKPQPPTSTLPNMNTGAGPTTNPSTGGAGGMFAGLTTKKKPVGSEPTNMPTQGSFQQQQLNTSQTGDGSASFNEGFGTPSNTMPKKTNAFGFINKSPQTQEQQQPSQPEVNSGMNMFGGMQVKSQPVMQHQSMDLLDFDDAGTEPEKPVQQYHPQPLDNIFQPVEQQPKPSPFGFAKFKKEPTSQSNSILAELDTEKEQGFGLDSKVNDSTDLGEKPGFGAINESFDKQSAISHHYDEQSLSMADNVDMRLEATDYTPTHGGYTTSPKEEVATTGPKALFGKFKSKPKPEPQETQNIAAPKSHMPQLGEKPELTPDKFVLQLQIHINNNQEKLGDIIVQQYNIKQSKEAKETEIGELKERLQDIIQKQNFAIENDRFEEADELEKATEEVRMQIKALEEEIDECNVHYTALDKEAQTLYQEEYETYKNFIDALEQALYHRNKELSEYIFEGERTQAKDKDYAEREQHSLESTKKDLEFKQKTLEENKKHIGEQMEKQTKESFEEQGRLAERKDTLAEDIRRIKQELAAKEAEFSEVSLQLEKVNKQIGYVQKRFEADFLKLKTKEEEVHAIEEVYEKKLKNLNSFKERINNEGETFQQTVQKNREIIKELEKLKDEYKNTMVEINRVNKKREQLLELFQSSELEYQNAKLEVRHKEEEVQNLTHEIKMIQGKVNGLMVTKGGLAQKLPFLDTEKRNYAQARNFKEASRVTNEIKDIQAQITKIEEDIATLNSKEKANQELIEKIQNEILVSLKYEMERLKERSDENKYNLLGKKLKDLTMIQEHLKKAGLYDNCARIERELENCRAEMASIRSMYPGKFDETKETEATVSSVKTEQWSQQTQHTENPVQQVDAFEEKKNDYEEEKRSEVKQGHSYDLGVTAEEFMELDETAKKEKLREGLHMHDELEQKIAELDQKIEECTENERYEEADKLNDEQQELINAKNIIFMLFIKAGYTSTDTLRSYLSEEAQ